jgi:hypothetical protein
MPQVPTFAILRYFPKPLPPLCQNTAVIYPESFILT